MKEIFEKLIDALSAEPCYLAIVSAMIVSYFIINNNNKHLQKMEEIRISQFKKATS